MVIWIRYFWVNTYSIHIIKITPSQSKVSMLICAIVSLRWRVGAGVFRESWRIFRQSPQFLLLRITASTCKKRGIVHSTPMPLFLFLFSTFFNCAVGRSFLAPYFTDSPKCDKISSNQKIYQTAMLCWFCLMEAAL